MERYTKDMVYLRGTKRIRSSEIKRNLKFTGANKNKNLQSKDQLLLVLIRVRFGLLNEDLADIFCISLAHCSNIFRM